MKRLAIILLICFSSVSAQSQEILKQLTRLDTLYSEADYEKARELADKIYPLASSSIKNDTIFLEFLNTIGSIYYNLGVYEKALLYFKEAAAKAKTVLGENDYNYALAIFNIAGSFKELGRYTEAEPLYLKSLPVLAVAFGQNSLEYTRCFYTLALLYLETGKYKEAESMVAAAVNYYKVNPGPTSDDYLGALGTMAVIYQGQSRYDKAEELFLALKNHYAALIPPPHSTLQTLENNLGELYRHMGDYNRAEEFLTRAVQMAGNSSSAAYSLNNLALVYKAIGKFQEAESSYKKAIAIYKELKKNHHPDYTNPVNNLGELYRTMGRLQDAVYAFEEVINIRKETLGTNHANYANALNNLALVKFALGLYPEAENHLLECKEIYKNILGEQDKLYANSLNNLASVYKASGKLKKAEETYKESLRIYKAGYGDSSDKYAIYLGGLAGTYRLMKDYKQAIPLTLTSLAILEKKLGRQHYDFIETQYNLAETYREALDFSKAEKYYLDAMDGYLLLIEKYFPFLSEKDKTSFYFNVANAFETFNSFVIRLRQLFPLKDHSALVSRMYDNQVALKSLLLKESEKLRTAITGSKDKSLKEDYHQWMALREQIIQHYRLSSDELESRQVNIPLLEKQVNDLEQKLSIALNLGNSTMQKRLSWQDIKGGLKDGEYAMEIVRTDFYNNARWTDSVYYSALILNKDSRAPHLIVLDGNFLESTAIATYRKALKSRITEDRSYEAFWAPLINFMPGASRIFISPDGVYQQLNLYTFQNPVTKAYLIDETDIRLVSNSKDILTKRKTASAKTAVIFSYPDYRAGNADKTSPDKRIPGFPDLDELPGTKIEADSIKKLLTVHQWRVEDHMQKSASEEALKKISKPGILHIATHGFFLKDVRDDKEKTLGLQTAAVRQNPLLRSGVIMSGAMATVNNSTSNNAVDDGILTAYEAAGMDLGSTELVVLSACETGLGEILNGQGVYGLQRSFLVAGAGSVIMSLWKIDDVATQKLMTQFYREWLQNPALGKHTALKAAQMKLRKVYSHPYYWGAFVLVGSE